MSCVGSSLSQCKEVTLSFNHDIKNLIDNPPSNQFPLETYSCWSWVIENLLQVLYGRDYEPRWRLPDRWYDFVSGIRQDSPSISPSSTPSRWDLVSTTRRRSCNGSTTHLRPRRPNGGWLSYVIRHMTPDITALSTRSSTNKWVKWSSGL